MMKNPLLAMVMRSIAPKTVMAGDSGAGGTGEDLARAIEEHRKWLEHLKTIGPEKAAKWYKEAGAVQARKLEAAVAEAMERGKSNPAVPRPQSASPQAVTPRDFGAGGTGEDLSRAIEEHRKWLEHLKTIGPEKAAKWYKEAGAVQARKLEAAVAEAMERGKSNPAVPQPQSASLQAVSDWARTRGIGLFHFTSRANLEGIRKYGLLSWAACVGKVHVAEPGGDDRSHRRDARINLQDRNLQHFVHLCFVDMHQMEYVATDNRRIHDPVYLKINLRVLDGDDVWFSNVNASDGNADFGQGLEWFQTRINWDLIVHRKDVDGIAKFLWYPPKYPKKGLGAKQQWQAEALVPRRIDPGCIEQVVRRGELSRQAFPRAVIDLEAIRKLLDDGDLSF